MDSPARPHGPRSSTTGTVTVAELIARCTGVPAPPPRPVGPDGAVSVAALLRREGRGPHVADRPLVPRGHARVTQPPPEPPRRNLRKAMVAGGALFAATAVLGPSVVEDGAGRSGTGQGTGVPLPPVSAPLAAGYDWSDNLALVDPTRAEGAVLSAMRQVFATGIPSEVDSTPLERLTDVRTAAAQYSATTRAQTPDGASAGFTGPTVTPPSGTVPPGGAGTPPGGNGSRGAAPPGLLSRGVAGDGPPADTPGNGPPAGTPAAARSGTPGEGQLASTPAGNGNGEGHGLGKGAGRSNESPGRAGTAESHGPSEALSAANSEGSGGAGHQGRSGEKGGRGDKASGEGTSRTNSDDKKNSENSGGSDSGDSDSGGSDRRAQKTDGRAADDSRDRGDKNSEKDSSDKNSGDKSDKSGDKGGGKGGGKGGKD